MGSRRYATIGSRSIADSDPETHYIGSGKRPDRKRMSAVRAALHRAISGRDLDESQAHAAMLEVLNGDSTPVLTAALLTALRMKGEVGAEVTGFARAMRASALRGAAPDGPAGAARRHLRHRRRRRGDVQRVDRFGSGRGGGRSGHRQAWKPLNFEPVRIGRRAGGPWGECRLGCRPGGGLHRRGRNRIPVRSGNAPGHAARRDRCGRNSECGRYSTCSGRSRIPRGAAIQVMGVYDDGIVSIAADALRRLGAQRALVVHGWRRHGRDHFGRSHPRIAEVRDGAVRERRVEPADFGLSTADASQIAGGDAATNAALVRSVLAGDRGAPRDIVLANAAAALRMAGRASSWSGAAAIAADSVDSGAAAAKLERLAEFSNDVASRS